MSLYAVPVRRESDGSEAKVKQSLNVLRKTEQPAPVEPGAAECAVTGEPEMKNCEPTFAINCRIANQKRYALIGSTSLEKSFVRSKREQK